MMESLEEFRGKFVPFITSIVGSPRLSNRVEELYSVLQNVSLDKDKVVLEYGAWPGLYGCYIAPMVKEIYCIDNCSFIKRGGCGGPSFAEWLEQINRFNFPNIKAIEMDILRTSFPDKFFDYIISFGVHEHIQDDVGALREIGRTLKDDGTISITIDFWNPGVAYDDKVQGRIYSPQGIRDLMDKSGMELIHPIDWGFYDKSPFGGPNSFDSPYVTFLAIAMRKRIN